MIVYRQRRGIARYLILIILLSCRSIEPFLAPGLVLEAPSYPESSHYPELISARTAVRSAVRALEQRGVRDIRICGLHWIAAPTGAAILHATGNWKHDGVSFLSFGIGIYDGTEVTHGLMPGGEFFVVARGAGASGREMWYDSNGDRVLPYDEFDAMDELIFELVSREELAELPKICGVAQ